MRSMALEANPIAGVVREVVMAFEAVNVDVVLVREAHRQKRCLGAHGLLLLLHPESEETCSDDDSEEDPSGTFHSCLNAPNRMAKTASAEQVIADCQSAERFVSGSGSRPG